MQIANLSAVATNGGRYDLSRFNSIGAESESFVKYLLKDRHVIYDWGAHHLFVCKIPFLVNYKDKKIITKDGQSVDEASWIGCDPDALHAVLSGVFEGVWGPTAVDTITTLQRSGIEVDICNTKQFGPANPREFLENLKKHLS